LNIMVGARGEPEPHPDGAPAPLDLCDSFRLNLKRQPTKKCVRL
jgi:hypothetical protein